MLQACALRACSLVVHISGVNVCMALSVEDASSYMCACGTVYCMLLSCMVSSKEGSISRAIVSTCQPAYTYLDTCIPSCIKHVFAREVANKTCKDIHVHH